MILLLPFYIHTFFISANTKYAAVYKSKKISNKIKSEAFVILIFNLPYKGTQSIDKQPQKEDKRPNEGKKRPPVWGIIYESLFESKPAETAENYGRN